MSEENKERNAQASQQQAKTLADKENKPETTVDLSKVDPKKLRAELSNKNQDYLFKMHKLLVDGGYTDADAAAKLDAFLPEIVQEQRVGKPAAQLYGPPTVKADRILHAPKKPIEIKYWMKGTDWSLLYFAILSVVFGVMGMIPGGNNQNSATNSGVLVLLTMSVSFGFLLTWFSDAMQKSREAKKKGDKTVRPLWKVILLSVISVFGVMILISLLTFINPALNPVLPGYGYIIAAAISYGLRYLFRRHYHIKGRMV